MDGLLSDLYIDPAEETETLSRDTVKSALAGYTVPTTYIGLAHFFLDYTLYAAAIAGVLFLGPLWLKVGCGIVAGIKIANLGTLAHHAAHGNLVKSRRLNKVLGILSFMPGLFNYRLWLYDHHHIHHPYTNGRHRDSWVPLSKAEFDRLSRPRQLLERLYRSSWGLGFAPYMIVERWLKVKLMPGSFLPARFQASGWRHFAMLMVYAAAFIGLLAAAPLYSQTASVTAILLGFVVPFYVWMSMLSFTVYVQHTHARIPWFDGPVDRKTAIPQEVISLHLEFPKLINDLTHNVYVHAVHHVDVRIPFQQLPHAARRLNELVGPAAVVQRFSLGWIHETLKNCRLYDYEAHRWLDFDGRPTGPVAISLEQRSAMKRLGPGKMFIPGI
jgi:omega-6 fatty acid desaturase (delta-12 desaturase)